MTTKKNPPAKEESVKEARPAPAAGTEDAKALAALALRPSVNAAAVVSAYGKDLGVGGQNLAALVYSLEDSVKELQAGDMQRVEAMLIGQAHALQAMFVDLARRARKQDYLKQSEICLRMALKAQAQSRMTLETLAMIKNPPVVIARQANINNGGQQQVNNGSAQAAQGKPARAANSETVQNELLEAKHGERLDGRAAGTAGGADPELAPVGQVNRAADA